MNDNSVPDTDLLCKLPTTLSFGVYFEELQEYVEALQKRQGDKKNA